MEDDESPYDMGRRLVREGRLPPEDWPADECAWWLLLPPRIDDEVIWQALLGALDEASTFEDYFRLGDSQIGELVGGRPALQQRLDDLEKSDERLQRVTQVYEDYNYAASRTPRRPSTASDAEGAGPPPD